MTKIIKKDILDKIALPLQWIGIGIVIGSILQQFYERH